MSDIRTVSQRKKLAARKAPYWQALARGQHLGFRTNGAGAGMWLAKYRDSATGERLQTLLGDLTRFDDHERFDRAVELAREWFAHVGQGGRTGSETITDICEAYAQSREAKSPKDAADVRRRFKQYVLDDRKFAAIEVRKLTEAQVKAWRKRLADRPTKDGSRRSDSSLNRDMTPFRAALNAAHEAKTVTSDSAWKVALKPVEGADKSRKIYPDRQEVKAIIQAAEPELALFLKALSMVPIRPGALAALRVKDFIASKKELTVPIDKANSERTIALPEQVAAFFQDQCANKTPLAFIFTKDDRPWTKDRWKVPFKVAAIKAGVCLIQRAPKEVKPSARMSKERIQLVQSCTDTATTIYGFRHSVITDLMNMNFPLLSIAQMAGTSVRMIEKNYGHLINRVTREALAKLYAS